MWHSHRWRKSQSDSCAAVIICNQHHWCKGSLLVPLLVEVIVGATYRQKLVFTESLHCKWSFLSGRCRPGKVPKEMSNQVSTGRSGKFLVTGTIRQPENCPRPCISYRPVSSLPAHLWRRTNKTAINYSRNTVAEQIKPVKGGLNELWYVCAQERGDIHYSWLGKDAEANDYPESRPVQTIAANDYRRMKTLLARLGQGVPPPSQVWTRSSRQIVSIVLFCLLG